MHLAFNNISDSLLSCSKGTDVNHVVERKCGPHLKGTALKMASERGSLPIVRLLLEAEANPLKTGIQCHTLNVVREKLDMQWQISIKNIPNSFYYKKKKKILKKTKIIH